MDLREIRWVCERDSSGAVADFCEHGDEPWAEGSRRLEAVFMAFTLD
jgi:hypothetical protein